MRPRSAGAAAGTCRFKTNGACSIRASAASRRSSPSSKKSPTTTRRRRDAPRRLSRVRVVERLLRRFPRLCLIDVALVSLFVLLATLFTHTAADADLWGHLRFGTDLLSTGRFADHDPYSFTSDQRWVNHEWFAEASTA